jgi:hypothetical protein
MIRNITQELRALAQRATHAARDASNAELSHALEELAIELTVKAAELDQRFDD